jgi:hypothetical protein
MFYSVKKRIISKEKNTQLLGFSLMLGVKYETDVR